MRIIFAGGGTGGHLYPAVAVAEQLKKNGVEFHFMVSDRAIDGNIIAPLGYSYTPQKVSAYMGKGIIGKIKAVFKMVFAVFEAMKIVRKGDRVMLTGGFAAAAPAIAAIIKGCPLYLHEQNSVMGLVNRIFAGKCRKVFLSFKDTLNAKGNITVTGNPIRNKFYEMPEKTGYDGNLLVLGGSQGSRKINNLIIEAVDDIIAAGFRLTHQTGKGLYDEVMKSYGEKADIYKDKLFIKNYIDNAPQVMSEADMIISRSGAGAVFEIRALNCPAVYIPFGAASENHQYYNALEVEKMKGCIILDEASADKKSLMDALLNIKNNIDDFRNNLRNNRPERSAEIIAKEICDD